MTTHGLFHHGPSARHSHSASAGVLDLDAGKAWSVAGPREGVAIKCERGAVWVTVEGDPVDHVLVAPAVFESHHRGRVAALALEPARIAVESN
jgi:Protein of unknown function (DUF2917)